MIKYSLFESSLSRIWQHIQGGNSFGVMSPFRANLSKDENLARYAELKKSVRAKGYGFIEMVGGFDEEGTIVEEKSLFIPNVSKQDMIAWGKKYDQYSVIYKDENEFVEIGTNDVAGIGKIKNDFVKSGWKKNMNFDSDLTKQFFSRLAKGSHADKKYLFNLKEEYLYELIETSFNQRAYGKKEDNRIKLL